MILPGFVLFVFGVGLCHCAASFCAIDTAILVPISGVWFWLFSLGSGFYVLLWLGAVFDIEQVSWRRTSLIDCKRTD